MADPFPNASADFRKDNPHLYAGALPPARPFVPANPEQAKKAKQREDRKEEEIVQDCLSYLRRHNVKCEILRARPDKKSSIPAGWPDLTIICQHPLVIFVEMKARYGVVSAEQKMTLLNLRNLGWTAVICRSYDDFRQVIDQALTPTENTTT